VARVYSPVFRDLSTFDYQRHFNIDRLLSLEHLSAMELARGIRSPGSITVENFVRGELEVQELVLEARASALGQPLKELGMPKGVRIGSIFRNGVLSIAGADARLEVNDRITLIGTRDDIDAVKPQFQRSLPPRRNVVIAGGGETGYHLAQTLEVGRFNVTLMEADRERCDVLSARLGRTTVVHRDATQRIALEEERVGNTDIFVACTGDDENNIMAGVEARELGARSIMAIVNRPDYANVVGKLGIDHAVSPRQVTVKQILGLLTTGPVISRTQLAGGGVSVLEIEVEAGVPATDHVLANLALPRQCLIAAVAHREYVRVPGADDRLHEGETVIALVHDSAIDGTLKLFTQNG
jgi:trk system potassium uptake protein TrkA